MTSTSSTSHQKRKIEAHFVGVIVVKKTTRIFVGIFCDGLLCENDKAKLGQRMPALIIHESEENMMEKAVNKNQNQHWLGADTAGYDDFRIKQMMPLPIGTTVMAVDVDEDDNVVMRDCSEISQPYCLVLTEDESGKTDIYPYNLSTDGGIDVRGTVIPIRQCPKCRKRMRPHMEEYEVGTLYYTCSCGYKELGWEEMEDEVNE